MRVSIRTTFNDPPTVYGLPWSSVCDLYAQHAQVPMRSHAPNEKPHDLPLIGFCAFDQVDHKGPPGCRRTNMHPEGIWCIALDFDDADPAVFARVLENAKAMSRQGLVHTTWKHGLTTPSAFTLARVQGTDAPPGAVRARIVMPIYHGNALYAPMPAAQWGIYWDAVTIALGAHAPGSGLDTQCKNPERLWYLPCKNLDAPEWAAHLEVWG